MKKDHFLFVIGIMFFAGSILVSYIISFLLEKRLARLEISEQFFEQLEFLSCNERQRTRYLNIIEKMSHFVSEEAKKNPLAMSSHIEEMMHLIPKAGPVVALQAEEYASAALLKKMKQLREDANVAKLIELEKALVQANKEIQETRKKEEIFSKKVPVLLVGWNDDIAIFKITNPVNQEVNTYMDSAGGTPELIAYLEPGEYTVEFYIRENGMEVSKGKSTFLVSPDPSIEDGGKRYHARVKAPGFPPKE